MAHARADALKHIPMPIEADLSALSEGEQEALAFLVEAVRTMDLVYLDQMNQDLEATGGVFDEDRGNNFYPADLTREDLERYLAEHPNEREALDSHFAVVRRAGDKLVAVPYAEMYREEFVHAAHYLERAADALGNDREFSRFLRDRAASFRDNTFTDTDRSWVTLEDPTFELIIGPFEEYEDSLRGVKRYLEGILGIVNTEAHAQAQMFRGLAGEFDAALGRRYGYTPHTSLSPIVVIDEVVASGGCLYGYIPMACNLPNDEEIHREVGSKKTFMRNVIEAKFRHIATPIARRVLPSNLQGALNPEDYFRFIVGHELAHGLTYRLHKEEFLDLGSPLEEAKADIAGLVFLYFLADRGIVEPEVPENAAIIHIADMMRQVRFGLEEAHAAGAVLQYRWLMEHGALSCVHETFDINVARLRTATEALNDAFYDLSQAETYAEAQAFMDEWGSPTEELRAVAQSLDGLPVDIDPQFSV